MIVARVMVERFGSDTTAKMENCSVFNRRVGEEEAAKFWNEVAKAARELQRQGASEA